MSDVDLNEQVDLLTFRYRCPICSSDEKVSFVIPESNSEVKFKCKQCGFENSVKIKLGNR